MPKQPRSKLTKLDIALKLHDLGFWVVPCKGKRATIKGWNKRRLTKEQLRENLRNGESNIALELGHAPFVDVECDSKEAEVNLQKLFYGKIPKTPTWSSKRGKHRLFQRPAGLPKKATLKIDDIEFRIGNEKGALSVIPPSVHESGVSYQWMAGLSIFDIEPAELPDKIVERLIQTDRKSVPKTSSSDEIPEGERNDTLYKLGCRLRENGLCAATIAAALSSENDSRCNPPLPKSEIVSIANSAADPQAGSIEDVLVLWHTPDKTAYATIEIDGHREHWAVRTRRFAMFIRQHRYEHIGSSLSKHDLEKFVDRFEAMAIFDGKCHEIHLRTAEYEGNFYLDLALESWQAVEIDENGWRILDDPPVRFRRTKAMEPLPVPEKGGSVAEIQRFVNVQDKDLPLLLAFVTFCYCPVGPYVILKITGEQGSAKSTTIRVIRSLIDPNAAPNRSKPSSDRELAIAVNNNWLCTLDNLSFLGRDLSDAICRLATTGAGFATRKLYTDDDEVIINAVRPVILAGIEDVGSRSDLLDRSVTIELPAISEEDRQDEKAFWASFEKARPRILGALLDAVSAGIRELPDVKLTRLPRMADFLRWATAVEEALGFEPRTCEKAYEQNRAAAHVLAVEESPVAAMIIRLLQRRKSQTYEGTATELLQELTLLNKPESTRQKSWPKNARALSAALSRLAPNLRHVGLFIERGERDSGNDKRKTIRLRAENLPKMSAQAKQVEDIMSRHPWANVFDNQRPKQPAARVGKVGKKKKKKKKF